MISSRLWFVEDDYDNPKELDMPATYLGRAPLRKDSLRDLRINTFSKGTLHERYLSSEEEPSPSPDSETASSAGDDETEDRKVEPEVVQPPVEKQIDENVEPLVYKAEVAIAVPIMAIGRPKLVDITNLAPMHKRKRSLEKESLARTAVKNAAARIPATTNDENILTPAPYKKPALSSPSSQESLSIRENELAPDSWLPDDSSDSVSTIQEDFEDSDVESEHYFPALDIRPPLTYNDYDPYSLHPPKLSPSISYSNSRSSSASGPSGQTQSAILPAKKPGSIARARKQASIPNTLLRRRSSNNRVPRAGSAVGQSSQGSSPSWKGLTRSLSIAKKQEAMHPANALLREAKKPKMQARGATEREETPLIPPFPFQEAAQVV